MTKLDLSLTPPKDLQRSVGGALAESTSNRGVGVVNSELSSPWEGHMGHIQARVLVRVDRLKQE